MSRLKELRKEKGYTLKDVSEATGYTKSFLSQLERELKKPSLDSLRKIADFLDVPIVALLEEGGGEEPPKDGCTVLTAAQHRRIQLSPRSLVQYEMLTPNTGGRGLEGYVCHIAPGESSSGQPICHRHTECAYVLAGSMCAAVGTVFYELSAGSSIYIEPNVPHNFFNNADTPLILIGFYST